MNLDINSYHRANCRKYEILRLNERRETGEPCSCGLEDALLEYGTGVEKELLQSIIARSPSNQSRGAYAAMLLEGMNHDQPPAQ